MEVKAMRSFLARRSPSPAMAVAFVALLAALSGTAVALPGRNTVDSGDLKKNSVRTSDIRRGAVTSSKLRNSAVTRAKIRNGTITGAKLANNTVTGAQVNEASLGEVPRAALANNANAVGGHAANSLARVGGASSNAPIDGFTSGAFTDQITTAIAAPTAGVLFITASSWNEWDLDSGAGTFADAAFRITVDGAPVGVVFTQEYTEGLQNGSASVPVQAIANVAAGDHTVALQWQRSTGTAQLFGQQRSIQVLFTPFGATGAQP
jgi:hypothetical protein